MARRATTFLLVALTLFLAGCDHATKLAASSMLSGKPPVELAPGVLDLTYARNFDTAFSLTRELHHPAKALVLAALMVAGLVAIGIMWWRKRRAPAFVQVGFALVLGGAIGNVVDRITRGFVVDFVHIHHWPVFNVADIFITAGGLLLLTGSLLTRGRSGPARTAS